MKYSNYIDAMAGDPMGYGDAWAIHDEARRRQRAGADLIALTIGDHDFPTDSAIVESAVSALRGGRHHYTPSLGFEELREAVAKFHGQTVGESIGPENVAVFPGAQCGLFLSCMIALNPGDEVIVFDPMYVTYECAILAPGASLKYVPLRPENDFQPDPEEVWAAVTDRTRAILLNSPNNPTGAIIDRERLERIADICRERDIWMISDEVYWTLAFDKPHVSPRLLDGMADRTLSIYSLSKSHAMTGWRVGWLVGPEAAIKAASDVLSSMLFGMPPFTQDAALTALAEADRITADVRETYRGRRDAICDALSGIPKIRFRKPDAGMYVMIDVRETGLGSIDFAWKLLEQQNLALLPGEGFGKSLAGHLRLSYCVDEDTLREAESRISRFVQQMG